MISAFIGPTELILIGGLALLFVGGKKLPEVMHGLGKGFREFKDGMRGISESEPSESHHADSLKQSLNPHDEQKGEN